MYEYVGIEGSDAYKISRINNEVWIQGVKDASD